jgi:hypothetical protein
MVAVIGLQSTGEAKYKEFSKNIKDDYQDAFSLARFALIFAASVTYSFLLILVNKNADFYRCILFDRIQSISSLDLEEFLIQQEPIPHHVPEAELLSELLDMFKELSPLLPPNPLDELIRLLGGHSKVAEVMMIT